MSLSDHRLAEIAAHRERDVAAPARMAWISGLHARRAERRIAEHRRRVEVEHEVRDVAVRRRLALERDVAAGRRVVDRHVAEPHAARRVVRQIFEDLRQLDRALLDALEQIRFRLEVLDLIAQVVDFLHLGLDEDELLFLRRYLVVERGYLVVHDRDVADERQYLYDDEREPDREPAIEDD